MSATADQAAEAGFTERILAEPGCDAHRLAFSDWLAEHGYTHRALYLRQIRRWKFVRRVCQIGGWALFPTPDLPPPVSDRDKYWQTPPLRRSDRCLAWEKRIQRGWSPPKHVQGLGYYGRAKYYGVYLWEQLNILDRMLGDSRMGSTPDDL